MEFATRLHVLLVRAWVRAVEPVRAALHAVGLDVHITRVDLEPALHAALTRRAYDLVIHDPELGSVPRELIEARMRAHRHSAPLITLDRIEELGHEVLRALARLRN
jgi:hypothetical protein